MQKFMIHDQVHWNCGGHIVYKCQCIFECHTLLNSLTPKFRRQDNNSRTGSQINGLYIIMWVKQNGS